MPVCVGKATKLCEFLLEKSKVYETKFVLGKVTDTQDISGEVLKETEVCVSKDDIIEVIESFKGGYNQIPPMYSALKVNGKKLYELAREGIEVERKPRKVILDNIEISSISEDLKHITMRVACSKGTYIRTLCHDIGEKLGCGACMETLLRVRVDQYVLEDALKLSQVEELVKEGTITEKFVSVEDILSCYPKVDIKEDAQKLLLNGNKFKPFNIVQNNIRETVRVYDKDSNFVALYEYDSKYKEYKPLKMFL